MQLGVLLSLLWAKWALSSMWEQSSVGAPVPGKADHRVRGWFRAVSTNNKQSWSWPGPCAQENQPHMNLHYGGRRKGEVLQNQTEDGRRGTSGSTWVTPPMSMRHKSSGVVQKWGSAVWTWSESSDRGSPAAINWGDGSGSCTQWRGLVLRRSRLTSIYLDTCEGVQSMLASYGGQQASDFPGFHNGSLGLGKCSVRWVDAVLGVVPGNWRECWPARQSL